MLTASLFPIPTEQVKDSEPRDVGQSLPSPERVQGEPTLCTSAEVEKLLCLDMVPILEILFCLFKNKKMGGAGAASE